MTAPVLVDPAPAAPLQPPTATQRFKTRLAPLDTLSGDGRMIATPPALRMRPLPQALLYQESLDIAHDGAVLIGAFDRVEIQGAELWGFGWFDMNDASGVTQEAVRRIGERSLRSISVDIDDVTTETRCMRDGQMVECPTDSLDIVDIIDAGMAVDPLEGIEFVDVATDWRFMSATVTTQGAFAEAEIWLDDGTDTMAADPAAVPTAAPGDQQSMTVTGDTGLPIADRGHSWDGAAAAGRVADWAGGIDNLDPAKMGRAHFYRDAAADDTTVGAYKLPFADILDGTLTAIPNGIFAVAGALGGARGGVDIPTADVDGIKGKVNTYYDRMATQFDDPELVPPWEASAAADEAIVASLVATARAAHEADLWRPPAEWFADPHFDRVVPLQVAPDGRVFGHVSAWRDESGRPACHVGYPGACKTVPHSRTDYRYFHTGMVDTTDGPIAVGTITLGTKHANERASWAQACAHYADSGHGVAVGRSGEDEHGIWFAGARTPTATREQVYTLGRVTISPDWREVGGNLEMVGLLGVNTGGFPLPRAAADGVRALSLVAAGAIRRTEKAAPLVDMEALAEAVESVVERRERARTKAAKLSARIRKERARLLAASLNRMV